MEVIGGVGSVVAIVGVVAKLSKKLNEVKDSYNSVALNIQLAAIQLATIRDALEAIAEWRLSNHSSSQASKNLDATLAESLKGCAVLITVIDSKLGEAGYTPGVKRKIRHLWLEDVLKGYMSNLDGQVRALQLLLTSFQCRSVTEQMQRLERAEARSVFEQVRADTASLTVNNKDLEDTASILSFDPSVNFEMDDILLRHPAYIAAYGHVSQPLWNHAPTDQLQRRPPPPPRLPTPVQSPSVVESPTKAEAQIPDMPHRFPPNPPPEKSNHTDGGRGSRTSARADKSKRRGLVGEVNGTEAQAVKAVSGAADAAVPSPPITSQEAQNPGAHKSDDRSFASAVEAFRGELSTAFDHRSEHSRHDLAGTQSNDAASDRQFPTIDTGVVTAGAGDPENPLHSRHSRGSSDFDEMITLLPLASHFNISRKSEGTSGPPRRLSADSRDRDNRTIVPEVSMSTSSSRRRDSPSNVSATIESRQSADAVFANRGEDGTLETLHSEEQLQPSIVPESSSVTNQTPDHSNKPPSLRITNQRLSIDSDLYESSITELTQVKQTPLKRRSSADSDLYTSSVTENSASDHSTPDSSVPDGGKNQEMTSAPQGPAMPTSEIKENAILSSSPSHSEITEGTLPKTDIPQASPVLVNGPCASLVVSATAPASLPQSDVSHRSDGTQADPETQFLRPRSATTDQPVRSSVFRKPVANSLRRSELVSSDYVKYSNNEHHGLKIILTPDAGAKPTSPAAQDFTVPPSRPPPSVPPAPPLSTNSLSTLSPTNSLTSRRRYSNDSTQARYSLTGAMSSSPIERDDSINETLSTMSSSDRSDQQSLSSPMTSVSNTIATSFSHPPDSLRGQAQSDLHKLQLELTAAKTRGDTSAQKASLQRSMDIIQKTYLSGSATNSVESGTRVGSPPKVRSGRLSLLPKKSMSLMSMVNRKSKQTDLHEAARSGDVDTLRSLLEDKINPNARGDRLKTPQMEAAIRSHLQCLQILKAHGADEFAVDAQGKTALHFAVMFNQPRAASWLIQAYPPSAPDMPGRKSSRLAWATDAITGSRSSKILREASDGEGSRPLHVAAKLGMAPMAKLLLDSGSDIDAKDNWGRSPLIDVAILGRDTVVELLLDRKADFYAKDVQGMTALHWAAKNNHLAAIRLLLSKGYIRGNNLGWVNQSFNNDGDLPIHVAARNGHVEAVRMLSESRPTGLKSGLPTKHGESLIHITALANQLALAREILQDGADVNAWAKPHSYHLRLWPQTEPGGFVAAEYSPRALPLPYNIIPLHYACTRGYYEMTELLLENGAWVNAVPDEDSHGKSPLMMAVESGNTNLVCLLLARGAKATAAVEATHMTSLHIACRQGDLETAQELIRYGAKTAARTKEMRIPEELVAKVEDSKKKAALEAYFKELARQRIEKIKAQMAENRQQQAHHQPSLDPRAGLAPSPVPLLPAVPSPVGSQQQQQHGHYAPYQGPPYTAPGFVVVDPENDAFPDGAPPPAYTPGPGAPRHLANRQGVNRPHYG
ncbi:MAG: hypothetical protein Q9207_008125 [Kuettlingeria erythrocarpa]